MANWSLTKPPNWKSDPALATNTYIQTEAGWVNSVTGELVVAIPQLLSRAETIIDSITITGWTFILGQYIDFENGSIFTINAHFNKIVNVTGVPSITFTENSGLLVPTGTALYSSGSGSNTLVFTRTIAYGADGANPGDVILDSSIVLNGGTITDNNSNNVNLTIPTTDTSLITIFWD